MTDQKKMKINRRTDEQRHADLQKQKESLLAKHALEIKKIDAKIKRLDEKITRKESAQEQRERMEDAIKEIAATKESMIKSLQS